HRGRSAVVLHVCAKSSKFGDWKLDYSGGHTGVLLLCKAAGFVGLCVAPLRGSGINYFLHPTLTHASKPTMGFSPQLPQNRRKLGTPVAGDPGHVVVLSHLAPPALRVFRGK